jgi:hypothetical protein
MIKIISKRQLILLWGCVIYLGISFILIFARASWGFLRLASEFKNDEFVSKDVLFSIVDMASIDYWRHAAFMGIGFLLLMILSLWISKNEKIKR